MTTTTTFTDPLQALVLGYMAAALALNPDVLDIEVEIDREGGNYLNSIHVTGRQSGTRLRVYTEVVAE
jgi:hypothetical protein